MTPKPQRVAFYLRVSTDDQTCENQRRELEAWAQRCNHEVVAVFDDNGVSGAKAREYRRRYDALLKGAVRRDFDMVAAWSVDRLGRSLRELISFLDEIHSAGIDLYIHRQAIDTTTPAGRALFQMLGVFSEFEREMIRERVLAGQARARAQGKHIGRPPLPARRREEVRKLLEGGGTLRSVSREAGVSVGMVAKIKGGIAPSEP